MVIFRTFRVLCLVAGLLFVSPAISKGAISLRVNGEDTSSVTLNPGQSCSIKISSNDNSEYSAFIGFQDDPHGTFVHTETRPEAGEFATVDPYNEPPFSCAYLVCAFGNPPPGPGDVKPGVHFVFQYTADTPGQVELVLWDYDYILLDSVSITVVEPQRSLWVNGADTSSVTLAPGQSCSIEIVSGNNDEYVAYVGFQEADPDPHGTFVHIETKPEAGRFAMFNPFNESPFSYAYEVLASGDPQPDRVHFVFQYTADTVGETVLGLWDSDVHKVDAVSITVQSGACCAVGTWECSISADQQNCPYTWLGAGSDCNMCQPQGACCDPATGWCNRMYEGECLKLCPWCNWLVGGDCTMCQPPRPGVCCNEDTGECYMSDGYCPDPYTWMGYGTDCSSCKPSVEVNRFEINQCFQKVDGIADQNYVLIETKPFVVRVTLQNKTEKAKSVNVKLKVSGYILGDYIYSYKEPERPANPIKIDPKTDPKIDPCATCDFFFLDTDTENMKAGTYNFSLLVKDSDTEIWSHEYTFKSAKTVRFLAVEELDYRPNGPSGRRIVRNWDDKYILFVEKVFPVPKNDRKNVNHLEIVYQANLIFTRDPTKLRDPNKDPENLVNVLESRLKEYNNAHYSGAKAEFVCCVVPPELYRGPGVRRGNTIRLNPDNPPLVKETFGHEMGHIYGLGEEYVDGNNVGSPYYILDQTFRFDRNPPPVKLAAGPFRIVDANRPHRGEFCDWADNPDTYDTKIGGGPNDISVCCNGRFVEPNKAGYKVNDKQEVRFDPSSRMRNTLTMMSAVSGSNWISGPEYRWLIALLVPTAPKSKAATLPATAAPPTSGQRMLISGIIDIPKRTAELSPLIPVPNLELSQEVSDPNCRLVFKSSTETVLGDFNIAPLESEEPKSYLHGPFSVVVNIPPDTTRIQVNIYGVVADELLLTDNSPTVTVISPNGGEQISGEMAITWSASDPDSNQISYTVEFSHDNGTEWSALTIDLDSNELTVDSNCLPGGPNCLVKVIASDGWNLAEDVSNSVFSTATKPPRVTILDPEDGTILLNSESMQGRCTAYDSETGDINDSNAIVWSSSIDGFLGKGDLVGFQLSVGEHLLSATATDPEAKTGTDTVSVKVLANASDFNCDNRVDFFDLTKFAQKWQATCSPPNWCEGTDLDRSGVVDCNDLHELTENWLWQTVP